MKEKKIIVSGIKPTGELTLGNYLGAIKNFINLQKEYKDAVFYIFIADLHATTLPIDPEVLRQNTKKVAAAYVASGLDLKRTHIFIQSDVLEHAELGFMMESTSYIGELERMIQFKEKSKSGKTQGVRSSLLTYPALMAADILLYDADLVPIGEDQIQHLELTRLLAERFNKQYSNTFKVPEGIFNKVSKRIMSLQDPLKKMSKSSEIPKSYILLNDPIEKITKKVKSAVTDSEAKIYYDEKNKPAISNLLNILSSISLKPIKELESLYKDKSYKDLKESLIKALEEEIIPIQEKIKQLENSKELIEILNSGSKQARKKAKTVLNKAKQNMGLGL